MKKIFTTFIFLLATFCFAEIPEGWFPSLTLDITQDAWEQLKAVLDEGRESNFWHTSFPNKEEVNESLEAASIILSETIDELHTKITNEHNWADRVYKTKNVVTDENGYWLTYEEAIQKINTTYDKKIKKVSRKKNAAELIAGLEQERKNEYELLKKKFQKDCEFEKSVHQFEIISQLPHHLTVLTNALQFAKEEEAKYIAQKEAELAQKEAEKRAVHIEKNVADVKYSPVESFPAFSKKAISRIRILETRSNYYESFADFEITYSDGTKESFLDAKFIGSTSFEDILHSSRIFCSGYLKDMGTKKVVIESLSYAYYNGKIMDFNAVSSDCMEGKSIFTNHFVVTLYLKP